MYDTYVFGETLNALGFLEFKAHMKYYVGSLTSDGLVLVSTYVDHEEPDDDGFGEQWLYDWWLMDEYLNPIPEIGVLKYSTYSQVFDQVRPGGKYYDLALSAKK